MATEYFTDEILAANFNELTRFSSDVVDAMQSLTTLAERYEVRLSVLEKLAARPVVVKSSKVLILTAMGISAYAGYKYAEQKFKDEIQRYRDAELYRNKNDHPAGSKNNDTNTSPNEN